MGNKKGGFRLSLVQKIVFCILFVQLIVMIGLSIIIVNTVTGDKKKNITDNLETVVEERCEIIKNYVKDTEKTLTAYSRAGEIRDLLKNPTDEEIFASAQKYTETFSADVENLEGLYASEWNSHVLTHTNAKVVGITTREGEYIFNADEELVAAPVEESFINDLCAKFAR